MKIGNRLKMISEQKGYSQIYLASLLGVSKSILSNYEKDLTSPKMDVLEKMAMHLDTTIT